MTRVQEITTLAIGSGDKSIREVSKAQVEALMKAERDLIKAVNPRHDADMNDRWLGVALSGGGIRSASFALGVLQSLQNWELFRRVDYLSTVSGGGYIGTALTYFLQAKGMGARGEFPFGQRRNAGARSVEVAKPAPEPSMAGSLAGRASAMASSMANSVAKRVGLGSADSKPPQQAAAPAPQAHFEATAVVSFLRLHAHYLTPSPTLSWPAFIGSAIRAAFTALAVYLPVLVGLMILIAATEAFLARQPSILSWSDIPAWRILFVHECRIEMPTGIQCPSAAEFVLFNWPLLALGLVIALSILFAIEFVFRTHNVIEDKDKAAYVYRYVTIGNARRNGRLLFLFALFALMAALPWLVHFLAQGARTLLAASLSTAIGYLGTLWDFRSRLKGATSKDSLIAQIRPILFAALTAYGLLVLAMATAEYTVALRWTDAAGYLHRVEPWCFVFLALILFSLALNHFSNLNLISQHRMYRDRLMEAFCPSDDALREMRWQPSEAADHLVLSACEPKPAVLPAAATAEEKRDIEERHLAGPYHIINTALVTPAATSTLNRSRGGDNFVLSPLACGSDATGWAETVKFMNNRMTLPTAMAISGAALNAHSGAGQNAPTRNGVLSFLLTLFGAQLGFWAVHPMTEEANQTSQPRFFNPGFYGLTGWRLDGERSRRFVQLADGGHFENLALYELIRRRTDVIICSDAAQDKEYGFEDLGIAVERIRVDFGTSIEFRFPDHGPAHLIPGSMSPGDIWAERYSMAKRGFAVAEIRYPAAGNEPRKSGYLLYFKSTLIEGLPSDLYAYKKLNADFPNQTTVDQDFDEYQFEAYRELGYRLATQCFVELFGTVDGQEITLTRLWDQLVRLGKPTVKPA